MTYDPPIGDGQNRDGARRRASRLDAKLLVGLLGFAIALIAASAVSFAGEAEDGDVDKALLGPRAESTVRGDIYNLEAKAGGKYSVRTGGEVELDGSASKPAKKIRSYTWTFSSAGRVASKRGRGGGCPVTPKPGSKSGKTPEVTALCDITATLTVSDGQTSDTDTARINVKSRKFKDVPFSQPDSDAVSMFFVNPEFQFGANRCSIGREDGEDPFAAPDHWLHPPGGDNQVDIKQVNDNNGPFDGYFYVQDTKLEVVRTIIVNRKLLEGGSVYDLNVDTNHKDDLQALVESTRTHERIHGRLVNRVMTSNQFKLLKVLERLMDDDGGALRESALNEIRGAETKLKNATTENKVKAEMREIYGRKKATIWVPTPYPPGTPPAQRPPPVEKTFVLANKH